MRMPKSSMMSSGTTCAFIGKREDALFLGPGGTGKSHLAQAIGQAAIQLGYRVLYRETHVLLEDLADAVVGGTRKEFMESVATVPLLILDDFGMRKLPLTAAEDLLEIIMRRYERASTLLTSNRPVEDWGKLMHDLPMTAQTNRKEALFYLGDAVPQTPWDLPRSCHPMYVLFWILKPGTSVRPRTMVWPRKSALRSHP